MTDEYDGLVKPDQTNPTADDAGKLAWLRARLTASEVSPLIEDFDLEAFLSEMHASYCHPGRAPDRSDT